MKIKTVDTDVNNTKKNLLKLFSTVFANRMVLILRTFTESITIC